MLSSMEARERRRKSRNAVVLKQNCGVSFGCTVGCVMISLGRSRLRIVEGDVVEAWEASATGALLLVQSNPATVSDMVFQSR